MEKELAQKLIDLEFQKATSKFGSFASPHEGYAVLLEEVEELWDAIKTKGVDPEDVIMEAVQVGAMALRFLVDLCNFTEESEPEEALHWDDERHPCHYCETKTYCEHHNYQSLACEETCYRFCSKMPWWGDYPKVVEWRYK